VSRPRLLARLLGDAAEAEKLAAAEREILRLREALALAERRTKIAQAEARQALVLLAAAGARQ
jgi:hypothetical protein